MPELEPSIAEWRRQMRAGGVQDPTVLDELESHLRDDVALLAASGMPEARAFQLAVSRIGNPGPLRAEFKQLNRAARLPVTIGSALWIGAIIALATGLLRGMSSRKPDFLLFAHIFSVTAGYGAAFLAGGFGIYYICCRSIHPLPPDGRQSLGRAVYFFSHVAAGLAVAGLLLGMLWSRQHLGYYLGGNPRGIGVLCASVWLVALSLALRFGRMSEQAMMLLCLGGNLIVGLAWFGPRILSSGYGLEVYWPLAVFLGLHLLFLALGAIPARSTAES